jgi:hypothetical protein
VVKRYGGTVDKFTGDGSWRCSVRRSRWRTTPFGHAWRYGQHATIKETRRCGRLGSAETIRNARAMKAPSHSSRAPLYR